MKDETLSDWAEAEAEKIACADQLTEEQRDAIDFVYKAIRTADNNLHEMLDLTLDDARNIDNAEWRLRDAFPYLKQWD